jgi:hypothetical protein
LIAETTPKRGGQWFTLMSYSGQEIVHAGGFGEGGFCVQGWELINMPLDFATIQFRVYQLCWSHLL